MVTKIGLIADIHAYVEPLKEALDIFHREGVSRILCIGDIAGYGTELEESVALLEEYGCVSLAGNHEYWYLDRIGKKQENSVSAYFSSLPEKWESVVEGVRLYAVHGSPPYSLDDGIKLLDENGRILPGEKQKWMEEMADFSFDVLIVGHTHQIFAEWLGDKLVINPGSTKFNHSCIILTLPDKEVTIVPLSGKEPRIVWNWGMMVQD